MHRIRRLTAAVAVASVLGVAAPAAASALTTISISGATASFPLVSLLAQKYVKLHPNKVKFKITQGGAQIGVNDVSKGKVTIGDVSRDPLTTDPPGLVFQPIARYGICVVTNKSNPVSNLTTAQLISIFTGKTRTWAGLPGATALGDDRPDQPHVGRWCVDQLPDDPSGRQEGLDAGRRKALRGTAAPAGRNRPQLDRLRVELPVRQRHRERGRPQRGRLQQDDGPVRPVLRHGPLLRGHQRQTDGRGAGVHRLHPANGPGTQDHLLASGSRSTETRLLERPETSRGPTTAPSSRSARFRSWWRSPSSP